MRRAEHLARTHRILVGNPQERDHLEDLAVEGSVILKWITMKRNRIVEYGLDSSRSEQGQLAGSCDN